MSDSIFSRIIRGEIPCHRIYEDEHVIAFLDINPLSEGHTLVVPKRETRMLHELPPEEIAAVGRVLGVIAARVLAATGAPAYNVLQNNGAESGQEVPHVHFHIIPRQRGDGLGYRWKAHQSDAGELQTLAARIREQG